jgi:hypothetical protein
VNLITLAAAAALRLLDPTGDAAGDGTLMPPTSPAYANASLFDLQEVALTPGAAEGEPTTLTVAMGSIELSDALPAGFNRVVVDVYVDAGEGGAEATLRGPALLMPAGRGWEHVVRISPRGAFGASAPPSEDAPVAWQPLALTIEGDVFVVTLPWELGADADVYAVSGLYDAFSPTDWRELSASPSPWSFSSAAQLAPVVDVLAADQDTQVRVLTRGLLQPPVRPRGTGLPWLLLAFTGVVIALFGLWLRRRVPAASAAEVAAEAPGTAALEPAEPAALAPGPASEEGAAPGTAERAVEETSGAEQGDVRPVQPQPVAAAAAAETEPEGEDATAPEGETEDGSEEELGTAAEPPEDGPRAAALGDGWTDDGDEAAEDDLAGFVPGEPSRPRELRVEHSDEEEA